VVEITADNSDVMHALDSRVHRRGERRDFFKAMMTAGAVGTAGLMLADRAAAQTAAPTDADVLNFALNLEYLEANFYYYAAFGTPIPVASIGTGGVPTNSLALNAGARAVSFSDRAVANYAREIARDELAHVNFLRTALGGAAVAQPQLDLGITPTGAFSNAARAAGFLAAAPATGAPTDFFDPYANDLNFLYGAFIFEDVGVTAYKGASPLLTNKNYLDAAAGILAAEAYHAAIVRTAIDRMGAMPGLLAARPGGTGRTIRDDTEAVSNARDTLDGTTAQAGPPQLFADDDQGLAQTTTGVGLTSNIVPTDSNGIAYSRSTGQTLNIVYLTPYNESRGGFFPNGVNGTIRTASGSARPAAT